MMPFLITGSSKENQDLEVQKIITSFTVSSFDLTRVIPENSIGIETIRELKQKANLKPFRGLKKAIILEEAEKLTVEAQNAFLKTLEEPPENTIIILTTKNQDLLLPTLVSRCQIIQLSSLNSSARGGSALGGQLSTFLNGGVGEKLKLAQEITKTREEVIPWLEQMIIMMHPLLIENQTDLRTIIISFQKAHTLLSTTNVNPRLTLENLFLQI